MHSIKTYRQRKPFLGFARKPKITYMTGIRHDDKMFRINSDGRYDSDFGYLRDVEITLEKIFENQSYLALNHWVGVYRITYVGDWEELGVRAGDYDQYIVDVAAGKDDVVEKIQRAVLRELEDHNIQLDLNWVDLDIKSIKTREGVVQV
jgi:hypothetical protein